MSQKDQAAVCRWVEDFMGGRITHCERQARWRPAYFLDLERNGEKIPLYFRGDRGVSDSAQYALEHEMACLKVLSAQGIPVPQVFGFCPEPRGILMECSPGQADLSTAATAEEQASVQRDYMRILAQIHALEIQPFLDAGLDAPSEPERLALADLPLWEKTYRRGKSRPEPLIEFALGWLKRNVPPAADSACFVCGDSGQFLFDRGRVTAVIDLELAHLGDPAEDLGALRCRDLSEPLGDLRPALAAYEEFVGHSVDHFLVDYHTVRFAMTTPLATVPVLSRARPGVDLIQYLCWFHVYSRAPMEVIAQTRGLELPLPPLPEGESNSRSPLYEDLSLRLAPEAAEPGFEDYARQTAWRTAVYLERSNRYGPALAADSLADINRLLGSEHSDIAQADAALEAWIGKADAGADDELVRLLHRRCVREEVLLEPVLGEFTGARIQRLD
ncbi:MAG: phosphotransferase family protein [Myxococcota bacterium]|nr:phosphotransferase family protein [Myxococcota bacterium]